MATRVGRKHPTLMLIFWLVVVIGATVIFLTQIENIVGGFK